MKLNRDDENLTMADNSGHTTTLRFAQIGSLRSLTSYVRKLLSEIMDWMNMVKTKLSPKNKKGLLSQKYVWFLMRW